MSNMNLLVTIDKNYLPPLNTMLESYGNTHKNIHTDVFVVHSSLSDFDIKCIKDTVKSFDIDIHSIKITESWFTDTPVIERLPEESFYRLMAFNYLPENIDKILYLDPDIYIMRSLWDMYNTDLGDNYIAACGHFTGFVNKFNFARLGLNKNTQERYINSGVMLMNIAAIKQNFTIQSILSALEENMQKLWLGDQDLINILFGSNMLLLDEKIYNMDERTYKYNKKDFSLSDIQSNTAIVHYNGKYKPWLNGYKGVLDAFYPPQENKGPSPHGKMKARIKSVYNIVKASTSQKIIITCALITIILCIFSYIFFGKEILKIIAEPELFRLWLDQFGAFDELVFIAIRAVQTVIKFIPAEPLEIGSGYAWGAIPGMVYCMIGNMIGTLIIILLVKKYGEKIINFFLPTKKHVLISLFKNNEKIYLFLFFLYLIPGSPKDGFTYLIGILPVRILPFMIITGIARIPSVLSSTLCGSTLAEQQYVLSAIIFIGTALLAVLGTVLYNAYTKKHSAKNK